MPSLLSPPPPSPNKLQKKRSAESTRNWFGKSSSTSSTAGSASSTPSTSSAHSHQSHRSHQRNASVVTAGSGSGSGSGIPRPKSAYSASGSYEGSVGSYGSYGGSYVSERGVKAGKGAKKEKAQEEANNSLDSIETAGIGTIRRHPNPQPHAYSHPHPHPPHPQRQLTASTSSTTVTQGTVSTSRSGSLKYGERYKRVRPLFCDVVVEGMRVGDGGWEIPDDSSLSPLKFPTNNYALPLRTFAKDKNSLIIPPFEARVLFGNVEALLGLNEQFLGVLEGMRIGEEVERGAGVEWAGIIKDWMSRFSVPYTSYLSSYPQAKGIENSLMATTSQWRSGFSRFCEKTKMQTSGNGAGGIGNVGLRELLMEPIQRIPRYRLLMDEMLKHLDPHDSRRRELEDAIEIATKIANCDLDEETFRANCMTMLQRNIEDCPADLISNSRSFIDCIDLADLPLPSSSVPFPSPSLSSTIGSSSSHSHSHGSSLSASHSGGNVVNNVLHCTLFLFTDKLLIVKRNTTSNLTGRALAGLEDFNSSGGAPESPRKREGGGKKSAALKLKGVLELTDVTAVDKDGDELAFYFSPPPYDSSERWNGRPHRQYAVIPTTNLLSATTNTPETLAYEKRRFLHNLWPLLKTKDARSAGLMLEVEDRSHGHGKSSGRDNGKEGSSLSSERVTTAFWNVYEKKQYLGEAKKGKMVLQIDPRNEADEIGFGMEGGMGPFAVARAHSERNGKWMLSIRLRGMQGPPGEDQLVTSGIIPMMIQTLQQLGLHDVPPRFPALPTHPPPEQPITPTVRTRSNTFGLDSISRNLLSRDVFGSITSSHKRTQSTITKTSGVESRSILSNSVSGSTTATSLMEDGSMLRRHLPPTKSQLSQVWSNHIASKSTPQLEGSINEDPDKTISAADSDEDTMMELVTEPSKGKRRRPSSVPPPCTDRRPMSPTDELVPPTSIYLSRPERRGPIGPREPSPSPVPPPGSDEEDEGEDTTPDGQESTSFTSEPDEITVEEQPLRPSTPPPSTSPPRIAKRPLPDPTSPRSLPPAAKRPALDDLGAGNTEPSAPQRKVSPLRRSTFRKERTVPLLEAEGERRSSADERMDVDRAGALQRSRSPPALLPSAMHVDSQPVDRLLISRSPPPIPTGKGRVDALRSSLMRKIAEEQTSPRTASTGLTRSPSTLNMINKFEPIERIRSPPVLSRLREEDGGEWQRRYEKAEERCLELQRTVESLRAEKDEYAREVERVTEHSKQLTGQLGTLSG
ncbi:hypothetical protein BT69DRAFT_1290419, partial [Atractiella rhizophila]